MHIAQTSISFGGGGVLAAIMRDQFQERTDSFFLYHSGIFLCANVTSQEGKEEFLI